VGAFERLIDRYAEADTARATRRAPGWLRHEAVLLDSPFPRLERISVIERRATPVERSVDSVPWTGPCRCRASHTT
jgi:hypothetical protein